MKDLTYLEKAEVDVLINAAQTCNSRDGLLLSFLWKTGARVGEMVNVKVADIEFHNRAVNLTKTKRNKPRRVYLDSEITEELKRYVVENKKDDNDSIFPIGTRRVWTLTKRSRPRRRDYKEGNAAYPSSLIRRSLCEKRHGSAALGKAYGSFKHYDNVDILALC